MGDYDAPPQSFDHERYAYVADKGPVASIALEGEGLDSLSYQTFRIFGLQRGYSMVAGVPGFYIVNKAGKESDCAVTHDLPAVLHPVDAGSPPVIGLRWKVGSNGNIYAMTIPTDLKLSSDADGTEKWLTDDEVVPRRLKLFKELHPLQNRDGQPLGKKFDAWIKQSTFFGDIKLKSLAAVRAWLSHSKFVQQFKVVVTNAEAVVIKRIKESAGCADGGKKNGKKKAGEHHSSNDSAATAACRIRLDMLKAIVSPLRDYIQSIAVPLGHRLLEIELGNAEKELSEDELSKLLNGASPNHTDQILELLKSADRYKMLQAGKAEIGFETSPLSTPECSPEKADDGEFDDTVHEENVEFEKESEIGSVSTAETAKSGEVGGKRVRKPPTVFTAAREEKPPKKAKEEKKIASDGQTEKRAYNRTGMYSKDPVKLAAARAAYSSQVPLSTPDSGCTAQPPAVGTGSGSGAYCLDWIVCPPCKQ
jgi:hypothetical protein